MNRKVNKIKIIGICLIKNEDLFIERVIKNIINFCDEIIVLDNMSNDETFEIVQRLSNIYKKLKVFRIKNALKSHKFIEKYANTNTWVFGVDGDEIYDARGLKKLREEILSGKYQINWRITGNVLHCQKIDLENETAWGYLSPPSRTINKLYNFSIIQRWEQNNCERLHGKNIVFKKGFNKHLEYKVSDNYTWENSYFRCLHLCFVRRSSLDKNHLVARLNPTQKAKPIMLFMNFLKNLLLNKELSVDSYYKKIFYRKGCLVLKNIQVFFN